MKTIDLNCDMGELMPGRKTNFDKAIMPFISSCNIACGFHSGNPIIIEETIQSAIFNNVSIGVHPSYNDKENFGRKSIDVDLDTLMAELRYQICAVKGMVESLNYKLSHVKPHGALYNDMVQNEQLCKAVFEVVKSIDPKLKIFALAQSNSVKWCKEHKMIPVNEGFADRRYDKIDQLRSRQLEGAVIHDEDEVLDQINLFLEGKVKLYSGETKNIQVDSICLHSDTKGAAALSKLIHDHIKEKNVNIAARE